MILINLTSAKKNKFSILVFEICVDSGRSARRYRSVRIEEISHEGSLIPVTLKILKVIEKAYTSTEEARIFGR